MISPMALKFIHVKNSFGFYMFSGKLFILRAWWPVISNLSKIHKNLIKIIASVSHICHGFGCRIGASSLNYQPKSRYFHCITEEAFI